MANLRICVDVPDLDRAIDFYGRALGLRLARRNGPHWAELLGAGEVIAGQSTVGGGSLPEETLPGYALELRVKHPDRFLSRLRSGNRAVIARIEEDRVLFDLRTVFEEDEAALAQAIQSALRQAEVQKP